MVPLKHDARSAMLLSGTFAILAAAAVPLLVDVLPPAARNLPLPLPLFCAALALQLFIVYGLFALGGLRLARRSALSPAPLLTSLWTREWQDGHGRRAALGFAVGLTGGVFLVTAAALIQRAAPGTLPEVLHPPSPVAALAASAAGAFGEEILFRLLVISLLLRVLRNRKMGAAIAVGASAILFALAHGPGLVYVFGGIDRVPLIAWTWIIGLNAAVAVPYGALFLRYGIGAAILAHFGTGLVWHVASQLTR